jgi:hypothetical protein
MKRIVQNGYTQYVPKEWAKGVEKHLEEVHKQAQKYSARNVLAESKGEK